MSKNPLKLIAVSPENYQSLKDLGKAGDSFNDVITKLLHLELMKLKEKPENLSISLAGGTNPQPPDMPAKTFYPKDKEAKINSHESMRDCNK